MKSSRVNFGVDSSGMAGAVGYIDGISREVVTNKHISSVVAYVQSELSVAFGLAADTIAKEFPDSFLHVYEWGDSYHDFSTVGDPFSRLWRLTSTGRGANRVVGFMFLPSVKPVPINPKLDGIVREGYHVFTWKAPIMEYGLRVTIKRLPGTKVLIWVDNEDGTIRYSKGPQKSFAGGFSPYGKPKQQRTFTTFFVSWWSGEAGRIYESQIKPLLEKDMVPESRLADAGRSLKTKPKVFSINTSLEGQTSYVKARQAARKYVKEKGKDYQAKANRGRLSKYGY